MNFPISSIQLQVGDYGKLDSKSGQSIRDGTILDFDEAKVQGVTVIHPG